MMMRKEEVEEQMKYVFLKVPWYVFVDFVVMACFVIVIARSILGVEVCFPLYLYGVC